MEALIILAGVADGWHFFCIKTNTMLAAMNWGLCLIGILMARLRRETGIFYTSLGPIEEHPQACWSRGEGR